MKSMKPLITFKGMTLFVIPSVLACLAFLPTMQAQLPPEIPGNPDGCYPAFTTAEGCNALHQLGGGVGNTAVGWYSNFLAGDASFNTGLGAGTLALTSRTGAGTAGNDNTALGTAAMILNLSGNDNTAVGTNALVFNSVANDNNAVGSFALYNNDSSGAGTANDNTAVGDGALQANIDGDSNTAVGSSALFSNTTNAGVSGISNNAIGRTALFNNTTGGFNNGIGVNALFSNTTGTNDVAIGDDAGSDIDGGGVAGDGSANVTIGQGGVPGAGTGITSGSLNTCVGFGVGLGILSASGETIIGANAGGNVDVLNDCIYIGHNVGNATLAEGNTIRIGDNLPIGAGASACFIGGIDNQVTGPPLNSSVVFIDLLTGKLGTTASSGRFKRDINPMGKTSEAIFSLKPVTFHYKSDTANTPCFGLIAEEVAKVNPALAAVGKDGKPYTVRYDQINAMLLNEFLKEHKKVEEQQASISQLKSEMQTMVAQLQEQAAQIQKVSAQLEVSKPAPQVVTNEP